MGGREGPSEYLYAFRILEKAIQFEMFVKFEEIYKYQA